jgi:SseB protein N-terminal domain
MMLTTMFGFGDPNIYQPRAPANPRLLKALASAAASSDNAVRIGLYEALMNSVLIIPTTGPASHPNSAAHSMLLVEDDKGQPAVFAFTDLAALQRWQPGSTTFLSLPVPQLLREGFPTTASGLWINIADRASRFVSRAELAQITSGLVCPTYAAQIEKELAPIHNDFSPRPACTLPTDLLARIVETLRHEADVVQAYVIEIDPMPKRTRLCVGLRLGRLLDDAATDALMRRVARSINRQRSQRGSIDVMLLDFKKHKAVAAVVPPLYEVGR